MNRLFITKGEKVLYEDKECIIIKIVSISTVSIEEIESHIIHTVDVSKLFPIGSDNNIILDSLTENDWKRALSRYEIIKPILSKRGDLEIINSISLKHKISVPTIYRWLKLFDETGLVASLSGRKRTGGAGKSRLLKAQEEIINDKIHSVYLNQSRKSITKLIREIQMACVSMGIKSPHSNTVRARVKNISEEERIRKRFGIKEAKYKFEPLKGNYNEAQYPLSVVQIDHTLVDIILVDGVERKPYKRPWLTVAIDVFSRMVLGIYLSFESPGALGTGMCISNAILPKEIWLEKIGVNSSWPCWGVMDVIHVDNAKEFHGNMLKKACQNYGMSLQFRPVATPHWGGHIERLMGTFAKEIHNLPGTTFSSEHERKQYKSEENSSFTLDEFEKWLIVYITKIYHTRKHTSLGKSPIEKYQEGILGNNFIPGKGVSPRINNIRKTRLDFIPYVERSIQEYGVVIDHIYYYDDVLRPFVHSTKDNQKEKFIFKRDPRDISVIYFLEPNSNEYYDIPYRNTSYPPISIWEYRNILKIVKKDNREVSEEAIFSAYRELNEMEDRAVRQTKKIRKNEIRKQDDLKGDSIHIERIIENIDETITPFEDLDDETFNPKN